MKEHRVKIAITGLLPLLLAVVVSADDGSTSENRTPPPAKLTLDLKRGISIDRQFRCIPPEPIMRFTRQDIQLIKSMRFDSVKVLVNPEPLLDGSHLDTSKQWYLKEMIDLVVNEGLPIVVCIHPEWEFKKKILSDEQEFSRFLGFLDETGRFLATSWGSKQLVLQLMTEPGATHSIGTSCSRACGGSHARRCHNTR